MGDTSGTCRDVSGACRPLDCTVVLADRPKCYVLADRLTVMCAAADVDDGADNCEVDVERRLTAVERWRSWRHCCWHVVNKCQCKCNTFSERCRMQRVRYVLVRKKARRNHNAGHREKFEQRGIDNDAGRIKCPTGHRG